VALRISLTVLLTVVTFAVAGRRVWWLVRLVRSGAAAPGRGRPGGTRVANDAGEVLGQRRLLKWSVPGLAHFLTFWGFVILNLTILEAYGALLIDRDFEAGEEPVKLCVKDGVPVELRKQLPAGLQCDTIGESVGFFRFRENTARRLAEIVAGYVASGRSSMPHEEAVRDLLLERSQVFDTADVTGAPWIEIDFPNDVARATTEILPQLQPLVSASR